MVSGCGSFFNLLKQEIPLWMTHKDPLSGGGWGGQEKKIVLFPSGSRMSGGRGGGVEQRGYGPIGHIQHFLKGFLGVCSRKAQDRVPEAGK